MNYKELKRLVSLVEEANISHLSIDENGTKIEIKKESSVAPVSYTAPQQTYTVPAVSPTPETPAPATPTATHLKEITAQMVGTFYDSPNPESPPFVKVGDSIQKGTILCIIEAMKLFNEIEAEESGIIEEICVSPEQSVEFGQPLFRIKQG